MVLDDVGLTGLAAVEAGYLEVVGDETTSTTRFVEGTVR